MRVKFDGAKYQPFAITLAGNESSRRYWLQILALISAHMRQYLGPSNLTLPLGSVSGVQDGQGQRGDPHFAAGHTTLAAAREPSKQREDSSLLARTGVH